MVCVSIFSCKLTLEVWCLSHGWNRNVTGVQSSQTSICLLLLRSQVRALPLEAFASLPVGAIVIA